MKLLFATNDDLKFNLMKEKLKELDNIELISPKMLGLNINDNISLKEKAETYFKLTNMPVIVDKLGLIIDKFKKSEQLDFITNADYLKENKILNYCIDKLKKYDNRSLAHYYTEVCGIDEAGNIYFDTIEETDFLLVTKKCKKVNLKGNILDSISYDLDCKKYFNDRTEEEISFHLKESDDKYREFITTILKQNMKNKRRQND